MKHLHEFRDSRLARALVSQIREAVTGPVTVMEVCGTHTMAIFRYGIRQVLPDAIRLLSGPGCPVCVTPQSYIDLAVTLAAERDVVIATFGDMLRVPGRQGTLSEAKSRGCDVRVVYSPLDAVVMAKEEPARRVVFLAVGFETTVPIVALSVLRAREWQVGNFSIFSAHKLVPPAMAALAADPELNIDGFLCPGHVSAVIGADAYNFLAADYRTPAVIAGFEPTDILQALLVLIRNINAGQAAVDNQYRRVVTPEGNPRARATMAEVFTVVDSDWRGIGVIPATGLALRPEFSAFDARVVFGVREEAGEEPRGCACGDILKGKKPPLECPLFKKCCTPEHPVGACMVSSEGTCAAYYKYAGWGEAQCSQRSYYITAAEEC